MLSRNLKIALGAALAGIAGGAAYLVYDGHPLFEAPRSELILMDETSLWHSPFNSGISYAGFEPVRVRRQGAEYFQRADTAGAGAAASGLRYGEIRLVEADGGLLYLPRQVAYDPRDRLRVFLRRDSAAGDWAVSVYRSATDIATVRRDSAGVTLQQAGAWEEVTIDLRALSYAPAAPFDPAKDGDVRDADFLLSQFVQPEGTLYGIGLSIPGGQAGDRLFVDRMALLKSAELAHGTLRGRIMPPVPEATVFLRSDAGDARHAMGADGTFEIPVPEGARILEVVAETPDRVISPETGRFLENGSYLPELIFHSEDFVFDQGVGEGNQNTSLLVFEDKYGPRFEPDQSFLIQVEVEEEIVAAAELSTNRFGYIDTDHSLENPDGSYRVMIHGGSHHMGVHLTQADQWWNEAGAAANMLVTRPVEVISASFNYACWTSSWPVVRDLGNDLAPDIVLLPIIDPGLLNLVVEEYMMDWLSAAQGRRVSYQFELLADGTVEHKPNDPDWHLYRESVSEEDHKRIRAQYVSNPYVVADPEERADWVKDSIALSVASLREFAALAEQRGSRVGILYMSDYGITKTATFELDGVVYDQNVFRDLMQTMARDSGVEFIDIAEAVHMQMDSADIPRMYYGYNGHLTPYGHYRYGQALGDLIASWVD